MLQDGALITFQVIKRFVLAIVRIAVGVISFLLVIGAFVLALVLIQLPWQMAESSADAGMGRDGLDRGYLCEMAASCRRYTEVRDECATAGNLKACVRIKMGDDASFADSCSDYQIGAPAVTLPPQTPDRITRFFLQWPKPYHSPAH